MELLYFIMGSLWVVVIYTLLQSYKLKNRNTELTLDLDKYYKEFEKHSQVVIEENGILQQKLNVVEKTLEEDSYHEIADINKQLYEVSDMTNAINIRLGKSNKLSEERFSKVFSEIQQLKGSIKSTNQNMI